MVSHLESPFTIDEVIKVVQTLKRNVALGLDGLPAIFHQPHWDIVREDTLRTTLDVLNNQEDPKRFNNTFIKLIAKINNPTKPVDFRPIALCNVFMKIITKTISNRIKPILPEIVSENESAFIHKRLIFDNTVIAYEIFHHLHKRTRRKKGYMGMKLDMEKAYDRLD